MDKYKQLPLSIFHHKDMAIGYQASWHMGTYDTLGIIIKFSFLGVDHLLHDGAVGLLDHADAQGVQDTQRRRLVQLFSPFSSCSSSRTSLGKSFGLEIFPLPCQRTSSLQIHSACAPTQ